MEENTTSMKRNQSKKNNTFKYLLICSIGLLCILVICVLGVFGLKDKQIGQTQTKDSVDLGNYSYKKVNNFNIVETESWGDVPINYLLVMLKENSTREELEKILPEFQGNIVGEFEFVNLYQVEIPAATEEGLNVYIEEFNNNEIVEDVTPDIPLEIDEIEGKPCSVMGDFYTVGTSSIPYDVIGLEKAWQYIRASGVKLNKVHVGVVDQALDKNSKEIGGKVKIKGLESTDELVSASSSGYNHGTEVAHIIGGDWGNYGVVGIAGGLEEKLEISVANTFTSDDEYTQIATLDPKDPAHINYYGTNYSVKAFNDIYRQIESGAKVINMSFGTDPDHTSEGISNIYKKFLKRMEVEHPEVVFVASAGNHNKEITSNNRTVGGIKAPNLITAGALDKNGDKAKFSNYTNGGGEVTLSTVGVDVPVAIDKNGELVTNSGTSFSAPQVAAAAALLKSINPKLSAMDVKRILVESADTEISNPNVSERIKQVDEKIGGKVLRIDKAILQVLSELPEDQRPENISKDFLEKIGSIQVFAEPVKNDPLSFEIDAIIHAVRKEGTEITVDLNGDGTLGGSSVRNIDKSTTLEWGFSFPAKDKSAQLLFTRKDSQACSRLVLSPDNNFEGIYKGNLNVVLPNYSVVTQKDVNIEIAVIIDEENNVEISFAKQGSLDFGIQGMEMSSTYDTNSKSSGIVDESGNFTTEGTYTSTSTTHPPAGYENLIPPEYKAQLTQTVNGNVEAEGSIKEDRLEGTMSFSGEGGSATGDFQAEKEE
ncbi:S8 family serine peptidase [Candidatus Dojkabacteria bacterium]|nr:S8 family serine peptidase [Candidatus Dojkabacteria bacterium]